MPMCVRCGREVETLVDGRLCPSCYLELYGLGEAPRELVVTICPRCGSYRFQGQWFPPPPGGLEDVVALVFQARFKPSPHVEYYRVEGVELLPDEDAAIVRVAGRLRGDDRERSIEYRVSLKTVYQLCPACHRRASGAPMAIVQIRGYGGRLGEEERLLVEDTLRMIDGSIRDSIISVDEVREGLDIKMLDQHSAKVLASKLRSSLAATVKESYKLIGQKRDGRRIYRATLSVRLPFFTEGSLVDYRGGLARVEEVAKGHVLVRPLGSKKLHRLTVEQAWRQLQPPSPEEEKEVMIAAVEPGWLHLQEIGGAYEYMELRRGEVAVEGEEPREGTAARLIRHRGRYYLLTGGEAGDSTT